MTLVDSQAAALHVTLIRGARLAPGTIRSWASAGKVDRHGADDSGRTLYDLGQVMGVVSACRP